MNLKVTVMGSGTSTGIPVIGCHCDVCRSKDSKDKRTRTSMLLELNQHRYIIDTPPELRLQALANGVDKLEGVFFTHAHADHTAGFDDLRAFSFQTKQPLKAYISEKHFPDLRARFAYAFEDTAYPGVKPNLAVTTFNANTTLSIEGVDVDIIELPHGPETSFAFRWGTFAFATDFKTFSQEQILRWKGQIKTMIASGIHFGTHSTHSTIPETLALFDELGVEKGIISHLSHNVSHSRDSQNLPSGRSFAYDGMSIDVAL